MGVLGQMPNTPALLADPLTDLSARLRPKNFTTLKAEVRYIPKRGFHGLFATTPLDSGEIMWVSFLYSEDCFFLSWEELGKIPEFITFSYQIGHKLFSHSHRVERDPSNYFNHSCAPNTWYDDSRAIRMSYFLNSILPAWLPVAFPRLAAQLPEVRRYFKAALNGTNGHAPLDPQLAAAVKVVDAALLKGAAIEFIVAMREIAVDEEITMDYGAFWSADDLPFECKCGAPNCRHWLKHDDWKHLPREHCGLYLRPGAHPIPPKRLTGIPQSHPVGLPQLGAFDAR